jgi:hypothetical protein
MDDLASLRQYGTPRQVEYLDKLLELGTERAAAAFFGVNKSTIHQAVESMREKRTQALAPPKVGRRIMVLPDVQAKPGVDFSFLRRIGTYMVEKKPDVVVCIGDFADMPSLSSYDKGKKSFEGRRYRRDIEAAQFAMQAFLGPLEAHQKAGGKYRPRLVMTLGNHEERILRAINDDPKLDGVLSINDLAYAEYGWEVHDFLEVVVIEGVAFSHYFTTGTMGRPAGTAAAQLRKTNMSCVSGHQQGKQIAYGYRADGSTITSIIAGSCYEHEESYLGAQGNRHWRGCLMLHEVLNGAFDEMWVSLNFINQRYPHIKYETPAYSMPTAEEIAAGKM